MSQQMVSRHRAARIRPEEPRLTIAEHLEELRRRLGISLAAWLVAVMLSWTQVERIMAWLRRPVEPMIIRFAFFSPTEPLLAYLKIAALAGSILSMPVLLWQLWGFVRRGLTPREQRAGLSFVWWGSALFLGGIAFAYYALLPVSLRFLMGFGGEYLTPMVSIDRYLSFVTNLAFWCGIVFELPVVLFLLASVGVVTSEWLRQQRSYAILILFIIAAIVTPTTDPINLFLMAIPMVLLYELSIWATRFAPNRRDN